MPAPGAGGAGAPLSAHPCESGDPGKCSCRRARPVAAYLAQTPSRLVAIALDDIMGEREQVNIPGTVEQHPNWRRKLPLALEDLEGCEPFRRVAEVFRKSGRSWG